eukprot:m.234709 g.234709  ORF g.234709 m.234709 type:complete len:55 (-) comp17390_c0_seq1:2913-3077(-)
MQFCIVCHAMRYTFAQAAALSVSASTLSTMTVARAYQLRSTFCSRLRAKRVLPV